MIKKFSICITILIIISGIFFIVLNKNQPGSENFNSLPVDYIENKENEEDGEKEIRQEKINKIMQEQGLKANESMFETATEYDGREVVIIKPSIQYQVALAGMIKKEKPEFSEIDELLNKAPTHTGIWIEESSREKILKILKNIANANYEITQEGFLKQNETWKMNQYDNNIKKMLSDEQLHIFSINSITYIVDTVTAEIQEYPFEDMDPYNEYEYFSSENKEMFIISANSSGKINQEEVLKGIFSSGDGS